MLPAVTTGPPLHDALDYHLRCAVLDWTGHDDGTVGALLQGVGAFPKLHGVLYTAAAWAALVTGDDNTAKRLWAELRAEPVGAHARLTGRTVVPVYRYRLIERWGTRTEAEQGRANLEPLSGKWAGDPLLALGPVDLTLARYSRLLDDHERADREFHQARRQALARGLHRWVERIDVASEIGW